MIAVSKVDEIRQLLAEGRLSQRQIAKATGISRATVGAIAAGKRPDYSLRQRPRDALEDEPLGPLARCGGCGGLVHMPCRLCRIRALKEAERRLARLRRSHASGPVPGRGAFQPELPVRTSGVQSGGNQGRISSAAGSSAEDHSSTAIAAQVA